MAKLAKNPRFCGVELKPDPEREGAWVGTVHGKTVALSYEKGQRRWYAGIYLLWATLTAASPQFGTRAHALRRLKAHLQRIQKESAKILKGAK
jgi:hypothetical protein